MNANAQVRKAASHRSTSGMSSRRKATAPAATRRNGKAPAAESQWGIPRHIPLTWAGKVPHIVPGKYADGLPYHVPTYLAFKMILRPNPFVSRDSLFGLGKRIRLLAGEFGLRFSRLEPATTPIQIREVLFVDTAGHRLYNNAFILRRRIRYEDGFPVSDPEVVFKYRSDNLQKAAETDIRPQISGDHRIKFKAQALPLKGELGGVRLLYSHNVQFPRSHVRAGDEHSMDSLTQIFPVLASIKKDPEEKISLVNGTIIEEVLQDIGALDFGYDLTSKTNVAIWRTRGQHRPLIGELAYQIQFKNRKELNPEAMKRAERFFIALQYALKDIIALNATKTGVVYRLLGNAPTSHE